MAGWGWGIEWPAQTSIVPNEHLRLSSVWRNDETHHWRNRNTTRMNSRGPTDTAALCWRDKIETSFQYCLRAQACICSSCHRCATSSWPCSSCASNTSSTGNRNSNARNNVHASLAVGRLEWSGCNSQLVSWRKWLLTPGNWTLLICLKEYCSLSSASKG